MVLWRRPEPPAHERNSSIGDVLSFAVLFDGRVNLTLDKSAQVTCRRGGLQMWQSARLIAILAIGAMYCLSGCRAPQSSEQAKEAPRATAGGEALVGLRLDSDVSAFLGVPYAAAPIGDLRWRPAQPHSPRQGNVGATEYGPACPQSQGNPDWYRMVAEGFGNDPSLIPDLTYMDEDCLYLNIWTPQRDDSELLPVMIWVHGGSNVNGWA
jgi:hypothetical protein